MIQIRHVPEPLHRKLKARAALEGLALSDYLLREVRRVAERPTLDEIKERCAAGPCLQVLLPPGPYEWSESGSDRH
jgi:hypothetical protein